MELHGPVATRRTLRFMGKATKGLEVQAVMNLLQFLKDIDNMGIEDLQELRRLHRAKICDHLGNDV